MSTCQRNSSGVARRPLVERYRSIIRNVPSPGGGLESTAAGVAEPDLSDAANRARVGFAEAELHRIVKEHLGDKPELHDIASRLAAKGDSALRALREEDDEALSEDSDLTASLEAIVRTDGSRPSFMVRDGSVDRSTSQLGNWAGVLDGSEDLINEALRCVGRINLPSSPQGFEGTGFLVGENLIFTNRHVLQAVAARDADGVWRFKNGTVIDFGHEFRGHLSVTPRALRSVVFSGSTPIQLNQPVDHAKLDVALIEVEASSSQDLPRTLLSVDSADDWPHADLVTFTVGYPGTPPFGVFSPSLLEQLFQSTFGCKRLAPGLVLNSQMNVHAWTVAHDATTLGGNSGSIILVAGRETMAAGVHYGGRRKEPAENWGHVFGRVLDQTDGVSDKTLRDHLVCRGVTLIDRRRVDR